MSLRSALAGAATAAVLVGVLGSPWAAETARDADDQALATTLTALPGWDVGDQPGEVVRGVALRLGVLLVVVTLLCGLAGRSWSRVAAFLGGWAALVVAGGVAAAGFYAYQVAVVLDGHTLAPTYLDGLVDGTNTGASFGLWTGWLVGLVVAATAVRSGAAVAWGDGRTAAPVVPEAPPPWWASTATPEIEPGPIRPGPSVFLPGGVQAPTASGPAGPEVTRPMAGPYPAGTDPAATWLAGPLPDHDATVPVPVPGMPAAVPGDAEAGLPDITLADEVDDPDATAPDATAPAVDEPSDPDTTPTSASRDPTAPIPRPET